MALVPYTPAAAAAAPGALVELGGGSERSIPAMLAAQQELFHAQVAQLQRLVVAQCRLTGVNPLAQEMAAGALSIKIGKRPRDLLNPKAVKYMQSLFAVKDTIGKKETREISALCGVTVTQVRDFFAGQRTRVRKLVRLSREKAIRIEAASMACDKVPSTSSEQASSIATEAHACFVQPLRTAEPVEVPQNNGTPIAPTDTLHPSDVKTTPEAVQKETMQGEVVAGVASEDKTFLDGIFNLMRKEESFTGQVKLMEWILQINNVAVLSWFLTMGGLTIVATWLSQAAIEEQTSVILVIFKVLLHLPLHKALPVHMSAVLQTINRLRFYRTSDISNRARQLLARLSKVLVRSQASKKPPVGASNDTQKDLICKLRISEILRDESWKSEVDIPEEILALTDSANDKRKPEPRKALMLLPAPDEPNKKNCLQTKTKERRKVRLVEQSDRKTAGRNIQVTRSMSTNNSRPLSADDIQKAKMRAIFMQEKYGKVDTAKSGDKPQTMESQKPSAVLNHGVLPASRSTMLTNSKRSVDPSPSGSKPSTVSHKPEISLNSKSNSTSREYLIEMLMSKKVRWQTPPEVPIDPSWSVGAGGSSKELDVQTRRNRREEETFYLRPEDVPPNPKDPWDVEMDFDDSLTPEIPTDQPQDPDAMEMGNAAAPPNTVLHVEDKQAAAVSSAAPAVASGANGAAAEPDLELLAVLLKNPELVFALTSGQGPTLPSEQTVALLDMLKRSGVGAAELLKGLHNGGATNLKKPEPEPEPEPEPIPASLPSPTPPSDPAARAGWRSEFPAPVRVPTLQTFFSGSQGPAPATDVLQSFSSTVGSVPPRSYASVSGLPEQTSAPFPPQSRLTVPTNPSTQQHVAPVYTFPNRCPAQPYAPVPNPVMPSLHQPAASIPSYDHQIVSNHSRAPSFTAEPKAYAAASWQPAAANAAFTKQDGASAPWAHRTNDSFDAAFTNSLPYPNENTYSTYNAYNSAPVAAHHSAPVPAHHVLPGQGPDRNSYAETPEFQAWGRDRGRHSRSPELGAGWDYSGHRRTDYEPEPSRQWSSRQKDNYSSSGSRRSYDWDRGQKRFRRR